VRGSNILNISSCNHKIKYPVQLVCIKVAAFMSDLYFNFSDSTSPPELGQNVGYISAGITAFVICLISAGTCLVWRERCRGRKK